MTDDPTRVNQPEMPTAGYGTGGEPAYQQPTQQHFPYQQPPYQQQPYQQQPYQQAPYQQPYAQPQPYQNPYGQPQPYQQAPPRIPRPSPFAGVPGIDVGFDAAAAVGVLATLVLPWTPAERGYSRPEVLAGVVLALIGILMSYLSRMGLFGAAWTPAKLRVAKLVAAAPLALCAVTYFVIDAVLGALGAGITQYAPAPGAWIATAAATLAALPRRSDLFDADSGRSARLWGAVLSGSGVALLVFAAFALLGTLLGIYRTLPDVLELRALLVLPVVHTALMGVWCVVVWRVVRSAARGDATSRLVLAATGAGALSWSILAALGHFSLGTAESLHLPFAGVALTMVAALTATSPSLANRYGDPLDVPGWLAAARGVFGLVIVANLLLLAQLVVDVVLTGALTVVVIATAVSAGAGAIAADWARQTVARDPARSRTPILIAAVVQVALGLALVLVVSLSPNTWEVVTGPQVIAALALPAAAAAFVTLPTPMRAAFSRAPTPQQQHDAARAAADPATPPEVLYALAQQDPALWPHLAYNPATPPDLLAFLTQSQDPAVHAALSARQQ